MASFRKSKNGTGIEVSVCINGIRRSKTFPNKTRAKSWAAEVERDLMELRDGVNTKLTLKDLYRRYATEVSEHKRGARWEIIRLQRFEQDELAKIRLIDLRRADFERWIIQRSGNISNSSINRELNLISSCLTQARLWDLMQHNPMQDLRRPKNPPPRDRRLLDDELQALLIVMDYDPYRPITMQKQRAAVAMLFAIETAMRAGELCSLYPRHIDREKRTALLEITKNGDKRMVPLSAQALELLDQLDRWHLNEPLFNFSTELLSSTFRKYVRRAGIENLTFHDTRHEAITRLASKLGVLQLARMVGHRDIKQLQTYYNESAEELAKLLD